MSISLSDVVYGQQTKHYLISKKKNQLCEISGFILSIVYNYVP